MRIPEPKAESFYWIQLYKLASASRPDRVPVDLLGPWYRTTGWPRSKAIRDLVRNRLAESELELGTSPAIGVLAYVYGHDQPDLARRLMHLQHDACAEVVSSTHVHLDRQDCLEVLILRGPADRLRRLADALLALKGVRQGHLTLTPARCPLAGAHRHARH